MHVVLLCSSRLASSHMLITCPSWSTIKMLYKFLLKTWVVHYLRYIVLTVYMILVGDLVPKDVWNSCNETKTFFFFLQKISVRNFLLCLKTIITCSHLYYSENKIKQIIILVKTSKTETVPLAVSCLALLGLWTFLIGTT